MAETTFFYNTGGRDEQMQLLLESRALKKVLDITDCITEVTWETVRIGVPSKLCFTVLKTDGLNFQEGDHAVWKDGGEVLFRGVVFTKDKNHRGEIQVICYDSLRYLKAKQSYNFTGKNAGDIIAKISGDMGLKCGQLENTGYVIPSLIADETTCLDTIARALELTGEATGRSYCFYDKDGALTLTASTKMVSPYILGTESFAEGYTYRTSIDDGVYNYVKLVRPNELTGQGDAYVAAGNDAIAKWGKLQYYERVNDELNGAQIKEMARKILLRDNRLQRHLYLSCMGISQIRAGQVVKIRIPDMGELSTDDYLTVERARHIWNRKHRMELEFSIFREADLNYAITMSEFSEYIDVTKKEIKETTKKSSGGTKKTSDGDDGDTGSSSGKYRLPFHGTWRVSTPFGKTGKSWSCGWHTGVDYVGMSDKTVYAICSGKVEKVSRSGSYGNHVIIRHIDGYRSLYAHLASIRVSVGQSVTTNTKVGIEGQTGNAFGVHLHLELHKGAYRYPPSPKINPHVYILTH